MHTTRAGVIQTRNEGGKQAGYTTKGMLRRPTFRKADGCTGQDAMYEVHNGGGAQRRVRD